MKYLEDSSIPAPPKILESCFFLAFSGAYEKTLKNSLPNSSIYNILAKFSKLL